MSLLLRLKISLPCLILFFFTSYQTTAQAPKSYNAAELELALKKLNVLGSALYVAAHPDDENTRLIAWLANEKLVNTAYLSVTRGDGGQNLIGPHISEQLGIIRTQELLQARRIDRGRQFFTRANDFGYSKDPEETFNIWDKDKVLADMVWIIRKFRPDVIITRFNEAPGETHGHHTASAILAAEAFDAAGDKTVFPEQLKYVEVWQPEKLFWNTSSWFYEDKEFDTTGLVKIDVGSYNALLGKSYTEIAAESRSMHKSQGFGASGSRGSTIEYLEPLKGATSSNEIYEGINLNWSRLEGGEKIGKLLKEAYQRYDPEQPSAIVPLLLKAETAMTGLSDSHWKKVKLKALKEVIKGCLGLFLEVTATDYVYTAGDSIQLNIEAINRSQVPVTLEKIDFLFTASDTVINSPLKDNESFTVTTKKILPEDLKISQPYWLKQDGTLGMYKVIDQQLIGRPENPPALNTKFNLQISGKSFIYETPVVFKSTDPVAGEQYRPVEITPPVYANIYEQVYVFADDDPKTIQVMVKSGKEHIKGEVSLKLPEGWKAKPASAAVDLEVKGEEAIYKFDVYPPVVQSEGELKAMVHIGEEAYDRSLSLINYDHIPSQIIFPEAKAKIVKLDIRKEGELIGYIMGAGDDIPASLQQIGYKVDILNDDDITPAKLTRYDAVILGVRAYNTMERLRYKQNTLFQYVKEGGTLIVQYNTSHRLVTDNIAPFPLEISRDRVTVEDAPVRMLQPNHPVLNHPNKITDQDFENWVQERGLYFPDEWADEYEAILSSNDPGEAPKNGGLLIAKHGEGYYIYTGYSWFRELPAGVPGAYRLFTNMISIGKEKTNP